MNLIFYINNSLLLKKSALYILNPATVRFLNISNAGSNYLNFPPSYPNIQILELFGIAFIT